MVIHPGHGYRAVTARDARFDGTNTNVLVGSGDVIVQSVATGW
jgi:hypothetical protein